MAALSARLRAAGCVFADEEARLLLTSAASDDTALEAMVRRREAGEPLEYVLGWAEFAGLRIAVVPGVFVPRRRTELLVRVAADLLPDAATLVDLCTGSGAVAAALAARGRLSRLHAVDIDPLAVGCAARNLAGTGAAVHLGNLYRALPPALRGHVDVVTANAPYVPTEAIPLMPAEARAYEARLALDGGADGLDVQRQVAAGAGEWLAPGGHLAVETSEEQADATAALLADAGLVPSLVRDESLAATVALGSRAATVRPRRAAPPRTAAGRRSPPRPPRT